MPEKEIDYYKALQDENYKMLLDREIQLDSARQRALKNTQVGLAAAGFGSAGYGQQAKQGIENQYLQGLQQAEGDYQQQNLQIQKDQYAEQKEQQQTDFTNTSAILTSDSITSRELMDQTLNNYGLLKNGEFDLDKASQLFGESAAKDLYNIVALRNSEFEQETSSNNPVNYSYQDAKANITNNKGKTGTFNNTLKYIYGAGADKMPQQEGSVMLVQENEADPNSQYCYLKRVKNGWVQISSEEYHTAPEENKYQFYYKDQFYHDYKLIVKHNNEILSRKRRSWAIGGRGYGRRDDQD